ncbi:MAG TPA: YibE/F family protein, partial [Arthrobacter sp.]
MAARGKANRILAAVLIPLALLTLAGMAALWPSGSKEGISLANPYSTAPGVTFDTGTIQSVLTGSCMQGPGQQGTNQQGSGQQGSNQQGSGQPGTAQQPPSQGSECTFAVTEPDKGGSPVKVVINPDVASSHGVKPGDQIRYLNISTVHGATGSQGAPAFIFVDFVRTLPIIRLAVLFAVG